MKKFKKVEWRTNDLGGWIGGPIFSGDISNTFSLKYFKKAVKTLKENEKKPKFKIYFDRKFPFIHWDWFYKL